MPVVKFDKELKMYRKKFFIIALIIFIQSYFASFGQCASPEIMDKIKALQVVYEQGKLIEAENMALEILRNLKSEKEIDFLKVTAIQNKLNGMYKKTGEYDKALRYIKEAYHISNREPDFNPFAVALYTWNLAATYNHLEKINEAMKYYEESIDKLIVLVASDDPRNRDFANFALPRSIDELLIIYHKLGMHDKTRELHEKIDKALLSAPQ